MSDVNPSDLKKRNASGSSSFVGARYVGTVETLYKWVGVVEADILPLTQRDLERVAALAMMPPGTTVEGLGYVWPLGYMFTLYPEEPNDE